MKIGCNTVSFRKYPLEKALATIAEAGYKYVEVEGNLIWCSHVDPFKDDPIKRANFSFRMPAATSNLIYFP